jgi:hypothetical protein
MAEQFILPKARSKEVRNFLKAVSKCTVTALAHANVGWSPASRAQYDGMMGLNEAPAIVGRAGLPPHFYIEIPANTTVDDPASNGDTDLIRSLSRGKVADVLKALDANSLNEWTQGHVLAALRSELAKGNVSISIYHLDGTEVGTTERDKVNAFPKKG